MHPNHEEKIVLNFIHTIASLKMENLHSYFAEDIQACITNDHGGVDKITGRENVVSRFISGMNTSTVTIAINVPQIVTVKPGQVLVMAEIKAHRTDRSLDLNNYAAFLFTLKEDKIKEFWMVEALPAFSAKFWS